MCNILLWIGFILIHIIEGQDENDNINIVRNDNTSKEIEKKGGFHMIEIIVIFMITMNTLFMLYCCLAEKKKKKTKRVSKYHVVSSDEFQFDTVDVKHGDNNKDNLEDINIGPIINNIQQNQDIQKDQEKEDEEKD